MSTQKEREENNKKIIYIIDLAAGSNEDAREYLELLACSTRIIDDSMDEFDNLNQNDILTLIEILFIRLPNNKFYLQYESLLRSQHVAMWNAWEASNFLCKGDAIDQIYAHVLRDYVNEVLPLVALLTQGYIKMKEVSSTIRFLFKKQLGE